MHFRQIAVIFPLFVLLVSAQAKAVDGDWFTDRAKALEAAKKFEKPILAVAMDHG